MSLTGIKWDGMDYIQLAEERDNSTVCYEHGDDLSGKYGGIS